MCHIALTRAACMCKTEWNWHETRHLKHTLSNVEQGVELARFSKAINQWADKNISYRQDQYWYRRRCEWYWIYGFRRWAKINEIGQVSSEIVTVQYIVYPFILFNPPKITWQSGVFECSGTHFVVLVMSNCVWNVPLCEYTHCCQEALYRIVITKAPFVNFSVSKIFDLAKVPFRFFESHL